MPRRRPPGRKIATTSVRLLSSSPTSVVVSFSTGNGGHRDGGVIAVPDEMTVPTMQPLLRAPGLGATRGRLQRRHTQRHPTLPQTHTNTSETLGHAPALPWARAASARRRVGRWTASSASSGTWIAVSSPARNSRTSLAASRRSVLIRCPGRRAESTPERSPGRHAPSHPAHVLHGAVRGAAGGPSVPRAVARFSALVDRDRGAVSPSPSARSCPAASLGGLGARDARRQAGEPVVASGLVRGARRSRGARVVSSVGDAWTRALAARGEVSAAVYSARSALPCRGGRSGRGK